jgi:hypothetical protein
VAGVALAALAGAPPAAGQDLLPDLRTQPLPTSPSGIQIVDGENGKELAFTNAWSNHGVGPWETTPRADAPTDDCDNDGAPENDAVVDQVIYQDGNGNGIFERDVDAGTRTQPAGCMVWHALHDHFHVEDAGRYALYTDPGGTAAGTSLKLSYCLFDGGAFDTSLPGAPQTAYYKFSSCDSQGRQGISIGWYDVYQLTFPGQQIDLRGVKPGKYCLRSEFDPEGIFVELDESNNVATQRYYLDPQAEEVIPLGACRRGTDPPNTKIKRGPKGKTEDRTPKFRFRADEKSTFECKLDRKRWRRCESPRKFRRLSLGRHKFKVRAIDLAGNVEFKPAKRRFKIVRKA